jgi:hypothetical protein
MLDDRRIGMLTGNVLVVVELRMGLPTGDPEAFARERR